MPADTRASRVTAGALLVALLTSVAGCSSGTDAASPSTGSTSPTGATSVTAPAVAPSNARPSGTATTGSVSPRPTGVPSATTSRPARTSKPAGTRPKGTQPAAPPPLAPVPSQSRSTQPPRPLTATATFGSGVSVSVLSTTAVSAVGQGPGEIGGPAVAYRLRLMNDSGSAVDLTNTVVTADYGTARTPAGDASGGTASPWRGSVPAGSSATATYVFLVPVGQRDDVTLTISYDPRRPVVVLRS